MVIHSTSSLQVPSHSLKARCDLGRYLGPAERAAVISTLECHCLASQVVRDEDFKQWMGSHARYESFRTRLAAAREADANLTEVGR